MLRPRLHAPDPRDRGRGGLARRPRARGRRREPVRRVRGPARRARHDRDRRAARRARALPLLRGAGAALRRAWVRRRRDRLLRPYGRASSKRDDEFPYMDHVAQTTPEGIQADVARGGRLPPRRGSVVGVHRRLLLRRAQLVALGRGRPRARRARSASTACPASATARPGPTQRAAEIACADPRAPGGRRPAHHRRAERRLRRGADRRRRRARAGHLRRRAAQLLRPQVRRVRGRLGGRVAARPRVRRERYSSARSGTGRARGARSRPGAAGSCRSRPQGG